MQSSHRRTGAPSPAGKPAALLIFFRGMNERVCVERRRERDREMFQFVSLILSSVCLSWRRVMSDSHAAWHCAGRRRTKSRPTWGKNEVKGKHWNYLEEFWGCSERFMFVKVMFSVWAQKSVQWFHTSATEAAEDLPHNKRVRWL